MAWRSRNNGNVRLDTDGWLLDWARGYYQTPSTETSSGGHRQGDLGCVLQGGWAPQVLRGLGVPVARC